MDQNQLLIGRVAALENENKLLREAFESRFETIAVLEATVMDLQEKIEQTCSAQGKALKDELETRFVEVQKTVEHLSLAFLGLTVDEA
jgi:phage shock protein A